jgi:VWFA-related protein
MIRSPAHKRNISRRHSAFQLFFPLFLWILIVPSIFTYQQSQSQKVPRHDAAAVVKLVPVRVLDANGRPVRGLRKEDFVLYDNKDLKKITEFEAHESRETPLAAEVVGVAETQGQPEINRKYFFILDMQGSDIYGNRDAKKAVLEFVESRLQPGDEASVMTFGALTGLVLKQYLTSDLNKIRKAISRSIEMGGGMAGGTFGTGAPGGEVTADQENAIAARQEAGGRGVRSGEEDIQGRGRMLTASSVTSADTPFGSRAGIQVDVPGLPPGTARNKADFDRSMSELAKSMKYVSGSKSVVYFSTRIPGKDVGRLFAEANATIYAVNTNSVPPTGGGPGASQRREMKERQGEALKSFVETSGGHYFAEVKEAKTIAQNIEALSGNYYVLGYYINLAWDGRAHEIKVEVKRPGFQVLVQEGYNDPKPFASWSELEKKMQLFDLALSDKPTAKDALDLPLEILFGSAAKEANAAVLLKLTVDERTGVPPEKAEIFTLIFDKDHKIVVAERGEMDLAPHAQKTLFPYLLTSLQPGEYECRVAARGMETGQSAAGRLAFKVPMPTAAGISLASPLLLAPGKKVEFVRMSRPKKTEKEPASIIRFYPFLPVNCTPLLGTLEPETGTIWALLSIQYGGEAASEIDINVKMMRADSREEIPIDWRLLDSKMAEPGKNFLLIGIGLPDLQPGFYRLEFSAGDAKTGAKAVVSESLEKK